MGTVLPEIHSEALRNLIDKSNLKHCEIARQLGVSRKTIQRWLNGKVSRTNEQQIQKLSEILGCELHEITNTHNAIVIAPRNRILEAILTADIIHCIQSQEQWSSLYNILKQFENTPLPTDQEAHLLSYLGYVQFQLGRYRSAWKYLNESLNRSRAANLKHQEIRTLCHLSALNRIRGDLLQAQQNIETAKVLLGQTHSSINLKSDLKFRETKILIATNQLTEAEKSLRESIALELRSRRRPKTGLGIKYVYLARLQLRKKDPQQALRYYRKALVHGHRDFQRHAEGIANYGMALCHLYLGHYTLSQSHLRIARALVGGEKQVRSNHKTLQIEFIFAIYDKNFARAKMLLAQRFSRNRQSKLLILDTLKMAYLLERTSENSIPMRRTWLDLHRRYSKTLRVPSIESQIHTIQNMEEVSKNSPMDLVDCLVL